MLKGSEFAVREVKFAVKESEFAVTLVGHRMCACVCLFYLFTQAGFCGSYAAGAVLRPSGWFPRILSEYSFTDLRMDRQLSWLLVCDEWF